MDFIFNIFKGILIGAGAILPGISSGVFCVIFGIYEKIIDSILYFFKNIKENIKFLFPLIIGAIFGVLIFSNILNYLIYKFPIQSKSIFAGLILGSMPALIKDINSKESFKPINLLYTLFAFCIAIFTVVLENTLPIKSQNSINFFYLILSGICMSAGLVIPGVSSTVILMLLGIYSTYIHSVSSFYIPILIPIGIGIIIGSFSFMRFINILLKNCYAKTFYSIIGFTIGSTLILIQDFSFDTSSIIVIPCIILGFMTSNFLTNFKNFQEGRSFLKKIKLQFSKNVMF